MSIKSLYHIALFSILILLSAGVKAQSVEVELPDSIKAKLAMDSTEVDTNIIPSEAPTTETVSDSSIVDTIPNQAILPQEEEETLPTKDSVFSIPPTQTATTDSTTIDTSLTQTDTTATISTDEMAAAENPKKEKPSKVLKNQKKEEKKFKRYVKRWNRNLHKSDRLYDRGSYGLCYGRSKWRIRKDRRKSMKNAFYAIDLAKMAKYLDGKGEFEESTQIYDSSLTVLNKYVTPDSFYYHRALIEIAEAGNTMGKSAYALDLLNRHDSTFIANQDTLVAGKMEALLLQYVDLLDDTLIVPKKIEDTLSLSDSTVIENGMDSTLTSSTDSTAIDSTITSAFQPPLGNYNDSALFYDFVFTLMETQLKMGYFQQANTLLDRSLRYQKRITDKKFKYKNPETGKKVKNRIKRREFKRREYKLADLYFIQAQIANEMGNYPLADSLFELNRKDRIKKTVGKKSPQYFKNFVAQGQLKNDLEEYKDAYKIYKKARKKLKRTNKVSSYGKTYYALKEAQARNYLEAEEYRKFLKSTNKFIDVARLRYSRRSPYFYTAKRVQYEGIYYKNARAAERRLRRLYKKLDEQVPEYHLSRIPYQNLLFKFKRRANDFAEAEEVLLRNAMVYKTNFGEMAPRYHLEELRIADFKVNYENDFNGADNIFNTSFETAVTEQLHPFHEKYFDLLLLRAQLFELTDRFDQAEEMLLKALAIINKKSGKEDKYYGIGLQRLAQVSIKKGNFNKAEELLERAIEIVKDEVGRKSLAYVNALRTLAELYYLNGKYDDSEQMIKRANRLSKRLGSFVETANVSSSEELAKLYIETGNYDDAQDILEKSLEIRKVKFGDSHFQLIRPYNLLGRLFLVRGDFVKAEKAAQSALDISQEVLSDTSSSYLTNLALLADIYTHMGDLTKAEELYLQLIEQNRKIYGENNIKEVDPTIALARVRLQNKDDFKETYDILEKAKGIVSTSLNDKHPLYAEIIQLQAETQIETREFESAQKLLLQAYVIWDEKFGKKYVKTADNVANQARLNYEKEDFDKSIELYDDALKLYKSVFSDQHPKYVKTQGKLARAYFAKKDYKSALKIFEETTAQYLSYIRNYFPGLSDNEKATYWASIRNDFEVFNSLALEYKEENPSVLTTMYNNQISTKAILLSSSIKVRNRILNSGDEELIEKYKNWVEKREFLTKAISMSKEELANTGVDLQKLEKEINDLEKELSEQSEAFNKDDNTEAVTWEDLQKVLRENETVVEMIRFRYFDKTLTDSVIYAHLIIDKKTKKQPRIVVMGNGKDLEKRNYAYYRNTIKYKTTDKYSYDAYWATIDKEIPPNHKIYISPDGIYNQLNVETFQDENGTFLIDKNTFYIISNSKDIVKHRNKKEEESKRKEEDQEVELFKPTVMLFGNPDFSGGSTDEGGNAISSVDPLPGAEKEVKSISKYLLKNDWKTKLYVEDSAKEEVVKTMNSPKVFHVATHGFFFDEESDGVDNAVASTSSSPLLKSGLLFSGASELLKDANDGSIYNLNKKEGVLTAYEAMNLPLDKTELVVLSACETGLGEIKDGEGVFGLQRAFLVAGAQNVIMSLFKVNDQATQELMNIFYKEWLETGDKRKAFIYAKNKVRDSYDSPIYWGSFIMIGLD